MKVSRYMFVILFSMFLLAACNKEDDQGLGNNGSLGTGTIYYDRATGGLYKIDLQNGVKSTVLPQNAFYSGWDLSLDGKRMLLIADPPDQNVSMDLYSYTNIDNGTIISDFKYYPTDNVSTNGYLSPDETRIAVIPDFYDGIIILDQQGNIIVGLDAFNGEPLRNETDIAWMPDGTLLFTTENGIYRTKKDFTDAALVRTMDMADWGQLSVSRDGSKIALKSGNHIWIMNNDGTGFEQVTTSDNIEGYPVFSPDGKYLLVGADYHSGPFSHSKRLIIVPLDGQIHNVNDGADPKVIPVIAEGETSAETGDGNTVWR